MYNTRDDVIDRSGQLSSHKSYFQFGYKWHEPRMRRR